MQTDAGAETVTIYKILRPAEWAETQEKGVFSGSSDDLRDGFVHLSSAGQVAGTLARHFADEAEVILLAVDATALGADLRWEESRGGALFPHLFAPLPLSASTGSRTLRRGSDGAFPPFDPPL
ncbi:MAG: DUF952 domain-containing protein [Pseudomonadota bacterium]